MPSEGSIKSTDRFIVKNKFDSSRIDRWSEKEAGSYRRQSLSTSRRSPRAANPLMERNEGGSFRHVFRDKHLSR